MNEFIATCRTCLVDNKSDLLSLWSVEVTTGMQICEMILQTSSVQVKRRNELVYVILSRQDILDIQQSERSVVDLL